MPEKKYTRCKSAICLSALRGQLFPAKTKKCPDCDSAVESVTVYIAPAEGAKGGSKGGGKTVSAPSASHNATSRKRRKKATKKQPSKIKFMTGTPLGDRKLGQPKSGRKKTTARKIYRRK